MLWHARIYAAVRLGDECNVPKMGNRCNANLCLLVDFPVTDGMIRDAFNFTAGCDDDLISSNAAGHRPYGLPALALSDYSDLHVHSL